MSPSDPSNESPLSLAQICTANLVICCNSRLYCRKHRFSLCVCRIPSSGEGIINNVQVSEKASYLIHFNYLLSPCLFPSPEFKQQLATVRADILKEVASAQEGARKSEAVLRQRLNAAEAELQKLRARKAASDKPSRAPPTSGEMFCANRE
jgi:hypothetical protein